MTKKMAFIFPGQGAQYVGMGEDLYQNFPSARHLYDQAAEILGQKLIDLSFKGPREELQVTTNAQPAIMAHSIICLEILKQEGFTPSLVAGHSLGEYSALVAAQSIPFEQALKLVRKRGEFMLEAVPSGLGTMAAILGLNRSVVEEICQEISREMVVEPANFNAPGQIVISGQKEAVEKAAQRAREEGAKAMILSVSGPFHCSLMRPAGAKLGDELGKMNFADLTIPLVNNADAEILTSGEIVKDSLVRQMSSPVRWEESMKKMVEAGVEAMVELGPGKVLSTLMKRIDKNVQTLQVEDTKSLNKTLDELKAFAV
ncbi:MAG: ACP S-malonyltransferase [Candidatus Tectomicrobia bacterium]|uniref:Malonyl CoA-acyl carrier protein transacylase n=1 Tax=Tectimicrobiota bacterium TaxID=2528274 RepID=A0A933GNY2_UNCTE|nr:ACP S-malonyltransferase [Candidatus Tectomicrobia bacterium]